MIEATGVTLKYPDQTLALKSFDLHLQAGEIVYITGPSGSGKTSLLKLLMGIEFPSTGSLTVMGQPITRGQAAKIRQLRRSIGPVFQEFRLLKGRTALENVMLGLRFLDLPKRQVKESSVNALTRTGLEHKQLSLVENMSLGEQQRVAIARAVARKPALILADEPTGNLDQENALNIMRLLASFRDPQTSVLITTHATHLLSRQKNIKILSIDQGSLYWERQES